MKITLEWLDSQPFESTGSGKEIRYDCPNCDDKGKHMYVSADKSVWYCFKCGIGGKVHSNKEVSIEIFESKIDSIGIARGKNLLQEKAYKELTQVKSLPFNKTLLPIEIAEDCESSEELTARNYLYSRGVTQKEITEHSIRLSLEKNGPYKNSIIFPIYRSSTSSVMEYFVCRKYDKSKPKYVNASWSKDSTLFITTNNQPLNTVVIVEGIFDALAVARVGYSGIALLGKSITSQQLNRLSRMIAKGCIVYLDNDALTHAIQLKLQLNTLGIKTHLIRHDKDAADLYLESPEALRQVINNAPKY